MDFSIFSTKVCEKRKSQPEGPPFQWETRLATGTVDPRVGISRFHCTPMIDSISHISNI